MRLKPKDIIKLNRLSAELGYRTNMRWYNIPKKAQPIVDDLKEATMAVLKKHGL